MANGTPGLSGIAWYICILYLKVPGLGGTIWYTSQQKVIECKILKRRAESMLEIVCTWIIPKQIDVLHFNESSLDVINLMCWSFVSILFLEENSL